MKKQRLTIWRVVPVIMFFAVFGLLTACGDRNSNKAEQEGTSSEQQRVSETQADTSKKDNKTFKAALKGTNEVSPVQTEAEGNVTVTIRGDSIHVEGEFSGLSSEYSASHIHKGAKGQNGDPIITLKPDVASDRVSGSWDSTYVIDRAQLQALRSDSLYVNVHTAKHKSGEIRGQLTSSGSDMGSEL